MKMNKFTAWNIGGLAGLATLFLLPFVFMALLQGLSLIVPLSVSTQEMLIAVGMFVSLVAGIAVAASVPHWLARKGTEAVPVTVPVPAHIRFVCPKCRAMNSVSESLAGQLVACGQCREAMAVPTIAAVSEPRQGFVKTGLPSVLMAAAVVLVTLLGSVWYFSFRRVLAERENQSQTTVNMKLLVRALHGYHQEHGRFPPAVVRDRTGKPLYSWRVLILPHLGEHELAKRFHYEEPWNSPNNRPLLDEMPRFFHSGFETLGVGKQSTSYLLIAGDGSVFPKKGTGSMEDMAEGPANTVCLAEVLGSGVKWTEPVDLDVTELRRSNPSAGDFPVILNAWERISRWAMFDGSVMTAADITTVEERRTDSSPAVGR